VADLEDVHGHKRKRSSEVLETQR